MIFKYPHQQSTNWYNMFWGGEQGQTLDASDIFGFFLEWTNLLFTNYSISFSYFKLQPTNHRFLWLKDMAKKDEFNNFLHKQNSTYKKWLTLIDSKTVS